MIDQSHARKQVARHWYYVAAAFLVGTLVIVASMRARSPRGSETVPLADARGSDVTPLADARGSEKRIVSLAPSVTEILFALDLQDSIVGVTDYCNYPPEAKNIERVGGFGAPNIEKLLAMHPDLVIATGLERSDAAKVLRESGIQIIELEIRNFREMFEAILAIGRATGRSQKAREIVSAMQAELDLVAERYSKIPPGQRPRIFVEIWHDPLTTAGGASFVDDVITRAGGINVAHDLTQAYPRINPEQVIEWNPDVIILGYMEAQADASARVAKRIGWGDIAAVKQKRIVADISPDLILRPGPRLIEGVQILAQRLLEGHAGPNGRDGAHPSTGELEGHAPSWPPR